MPGFSDFPGWRSWRIITTNHFINAGSESFVLLLLWVLKRTRDPYGISKASFKAQLRLSGKDRQLCWQDHSCHFWRTTCWAIHNSTMPFALAQAYHQRYWQGQTMAQLYFSIWALFSKTLTPLVLHRLALYLWLEVDILISNIATIFKAEEIS